MATLVADLKAPFDVFVYRLERDWPRIKNLNGFVLRRSSASDNTFESLWEVGFEDFPFVGRVAAEVTGTELVQVRASQSIGVTSEGAVREFIPAFHAWMNWRFGDRATVLQMDYQGAEDTTPAPVPSAAAVDQVAPAETLRGIVAAAMEQHPSAKRGDISQHAWNKIFAWCDRHEGTKRDYAAIAKATLKSEGAARGAGARYDQEAKGTL